MVHYGQIHNALRFQKYDHGVFTNMLVYKTATPPEYLMSMVTTLTFAYWGQNDWLAQPEASCIQRLSVLSRPQIKVTLLASYLMAIGTKKDIGKCRRTKTHMTWLSLT
jgi:hypothetical protein